VNEIIKFEATPVAGVIHTNMEETRAWLEGVLSQYTGMVFTEESKTDAKKTVADLRKVKKEIDDSRKEVKKFWMAPYERFEAEVKDLMAMVDKPIDQTNSQIEAFEKKRLEEREAAIRQIYEEEIGDMEDFLPLYRIQGEKWKNASVTLKVIRKEMQETVTSARAGKMAIETMQSDAVPEALRKFQATRNLPEALAYINQYEAQRAAMLQREEERKRKEEERRHQEEIERIRQEERQRILEEERIRREAEENAKREIQQVNQEKAAPLSAPESHTAVYTVVGTDAELKELEMAMDSLGLYFERKDI